MTTKPKTRRAPAKSVAPDPIFAAITMYEDAVKEVSRLSKELNTLDTEGIKTHGIRPSEFIIWRNLWIAGNHIDFHHDRLLEEAGADLDKRAAVENEYRDAKARMVIAQAQCRAWDFRTGTDSLRKQYERAIHVEEMITTRLARITPTTLAGMRALMVHVHRALADGFLFDDDDWRAASLRTMIAALAKMSLQDAA
ncbi:hypothetical protein RZS28_00570 [Methylocapsa polymorpha]|uniref:Uncharacterized protein n=1 Tax=Methylocapsa polymorpha TaxID=3080828 RepID=A0ABZ0HTG2_9HYPH|nr:hypothetical protein RZS28_00570 [Methylocapsa sp. RX1]